jgi:hypothetical protein
MMESIIPNRLYILNIGIRLFYEAAINQKIEAIHVNWLPPSEETVDKEIEEILNRIGDE